MQAFVFFLVSNCIASNERNFKNILQEHVPKCVILVNLLLTFAPLKKAEDHFVGKSTTKIMQQTSWRPLDV